MKLHYIPFDITHFTCKFGRLKLHLIALSSEVDISTLQNTCCPCGPIKMLMVSRDDYLWVIVTPPLLFVCKLSVKRCSLFILPEGVVSFYLL